MDSNLALGINLKTIRLAHNLTMSEMAELLGYRQNGAIGLIETNRRKISIEVLQYVTILFSVSLDWLLGFNSHIYNEEHIARKELLIFPVNIGKGRSFFEIVPEEYKDPNKRELFYNIKERANIIFLTYYASNLIEKAPELKVSDVETTKAEELLIKGMHFLEGMRNINRRHYKTIANEYEVVMEDLNTLLNDERRFIVGENGERLPSNVDLTLFDIEKQIEKLNRTY